MTDFVQYIFSILSTDEVFEFAPMRIISKYPVDQLDFNGLSKNNSVSLSFFLEHEDRFDLVQFSMFCNLEILEVILPKLTNFSRVCHNTNLSPKLIHKYCNKFDWNVLQYAIPPSFIKEFEHFIGPNVDKILRMNLKTQPFLYWNEFSKTASLDKLLLFKDKIQITVLENPNIFEFMQNTGDFSILSDPNKYYSIHVNRKCSTCAMDIFIDNLIKMFEIPFISHSNKFKNVLKDIVSLT